jgi:hypothetical protein
VLTASRDQTIKVSFLALVCKLALGMGILDFQAQCATCSFLMISFVLTAVRYPHFEGIGILPRASEGSHMYVRTACYLTVRVEHIEIVLVQLVTS